MKRCVAKEVSRVFTLHLPTCACMRAWSKERKATKTKGPVRSSIQDLLGNTFCNKREHETYFETLNSTCVKLMIICNEDCP